MDIHHTLNTQVIAYLLKRKHRSPEHPPFALPHSVTDPYRRLGAHPEIVEYLWRKVVGVMPGECCGIVYGNPALIHPATGIIFVLAIGTAYGLMLPGELGKSALEKGARLHTKWSDGITMDIRRELGDDWVFGSWKTEELEWCKATYQEFGKIAAPDFVKPATLPMDREPA